MNLGFENTDGPRKHQAFALRSSADRTAFFRCKISSYPDTLSPQQPPILLRNARSHARQTSSGYSKAVFQSCLILARRNDIGRKTAITTSRQNSTADISGFSFQVCMFWRTEIWHRLWGKHRLTLVDHGECFRARYSCKLTWAMLWHLKAGFSGMEVLVLILCFMQSIRIDNWVQCLAGGSSGQVFMFSPTHQWLVNSQWLSLFREIYGFHPPGFHISEV